MLGSAAEDEKGKKMRHKLQNRSPRSASPRHISPDISVGQWGAPAAPVGAVLLDVAIRLAVLVSLQVAVVPGGVIALWK